MRDPALDGIARAALEDAACPAAATAVGFRDGERFTFRAGAAGASAEGPIDQRAIFDLASVSKPFVALALARAVHVGRLSLADRLERHLPEASGTPSGALPLELFLSHRAGLEAHVRLFAPLVERASFERARAVAIAARARRQGAQGATPDEGFPPVYSDLGYALIGVVLERVFDAALDSIVAELVLDPLSLDVGSARQWLARDDDFAHRVLPTETVGWRGGELRGVVHDENAWALAGHGIAGQAGLFGTAEAVARFGAVVLDALGGRRVDWLSPELARVLVRERAGGSLRAGFDGKSGPSPSAGRVSSPNTFGHLGFTGTSLWCDPVAESVTVLLTNRVCPTRENQRIREARPRAHDAMFAHAAKRGLVSHEKP